MDPYERLKEKLLAAMKKQDPDEIKDILSEIDSRIPAEKIPQVDRPALARARDLLDKLRSTNSMLNNFNNFQIQ